MIIILAVNDVSRCEPKVENTLLLEKWIGNDEITLLYYFTFVLVRIFCDESYGPYF